MWLIGIVERMQLTHALEMMCQAGINQGALDVNYSAIPIMAMPDVDDMPIPGCPTWAVADMPPVLQGQLARAVAAGEAVRESIRAGQSGITLARSLPSIAKQG